MVVLQLTAETEEPAFDDDARKNQLAPIFEISKDHLLDCRQYLNADGAALSMLPMLLKATTEKTGYLLGSYCLILFQRHSPGHQD